MKPVSAPDTGFNNRTWTFAERMAAGLVMTSRPALFRKEAIDFQRHHRQWGDVASLQPLSFKITIWFLAAVVAVLIGFLFLAQYARKETAVGYLTPTKGTAKIFA